MCCAGRNLERVERTAEKIAAAGGEAFGLRVDVASPEDDDAIIAGLVEGLRTLRVETPEQFDAGRQSCIDTAIEGGAVPGMGPE